MRPGEAARKKEFYMDNKKHHRFSSGWGFVLSAVGSAVGMANVWGFPAKMGSNGGGAFLLAYLFFIMLFGTVGLSAEYAVGRRAHTGTLGSYEMAWSSRDKKLGPAGGLLGWLGFGPVRSGSFFIKQFRCEGKILNKHIKNLKIPETIFTVQT